MPELKRSKAVARHQVRAKITDHFECIGQPIWRPVGNRGYGAMRRTFMAGQVLKKELTLTGCGHDNDSDSLESGLIRPLSRSDRSDWF
jgi:hypothetical protein